MSNSSGIALWNERILPIKIVTLGSDPASNRTQINNALNGGNVSLFIDGTPGSTHELSGAILYESNTRIIVRDGVTMKMAAGVDDYILYPRTFGSTHKNIHIEGGIWAGNDRLATGDAQTGWDAVGMSLYKIDYLTIHNVSMYGWSKYCMNLGEIRNFDISLCRYGIDGLQTSDGLHINGNCYDGYVRNCHAKTNDDSFAITAVDYAQHALDLAGGNVRRIIFENLRIEAGPGPTGGQHGVKLLAGTGTSGEVTVSDIIVRNISGAARSHLVTIYEDVVEARTTGGIVRDCLIDGVRGEKPVSVVNCTDGDNIVIRNINNTGASYPLVIFSGTASYPTNIRNLTIEDCYVAPGNSTFVVQFLDANNTIDRLTFKKLTLNDTSTQPLLYNAATITATIFDGCNINTNSLFRVSAVPNSEVVVNNSKIRCRRFYELFQSSITGNTVTVRGSNSTVTATAGIELFRAGTSSSFTVNMDWDSSCLWDTGGAVWTTGSVTTRARSFGVRDRVSPPTLGGASGGQVTAASGQPYWHNGTAWQAL